MAYAVLAEREAYPQEHDISIIGPAVERMIHLLCNRSQRLQAGLEARRFDFLVSTRARAAYFCEILSGLRNLK